MEDKYLICSERDCGAEYVFSVRDQEFFTQKGFAPPKRCPACRKAKKHRMSSPFNKVKHSVRG